MRYLKYNEAYSKSKIDSINAYRVEQANDYFNNLVDFLKKEYTSVHVYSETKLSQYGPKSYPLINSRIEITSATVKIDVNCDFSDLKGRPYVEFYTYYDGKSYDQEYQWLDELNFKEIKLSIDSTFDKINFYEKMTKQDVVEIFQELTDIIGEIPKIDELDELCDDGEEIPTSYYRYEIIYTTRSNFIYPEYNQEYNIPTDKYVSVISELRDIDYRLRSGFNSNLIYKLELNGSSTKILIFILNPKIK